jgi:2,4-dienoyl-CoA reductase (NADPH2)
VTGVVSYDRIDDEGLHVTVSSRPAKGAEPVTEQRTYAVDNVVVCAGQESVRTVADALNERGLAVHVIGGAEVAAELDAKHAIRQGTEVASRI